MRLFTVLLILFLTSCSNEQSPPAGGEFTQVTVSFGSSLASGALLPAGQVPSNVQKITLQPFSSNSTPLSSPITFQRPNFKATLTIPSGSGIRIRAVAYNAAGRIVYGGSSTPRNFAGTPQTVTILLHLNIEVQAQQTSIPRNGTVNIGGLVAGAPPLASSPLLWGTSGGTVAVTQGSNGGQVVWTAPNTLGSYTITANIDPATNPDQNTNVTGSVAINVINQPPVLATNQTSVTLLEGTSDASTIITATDADADIVNLSLDTAANPANPAWATFDALTGILSLSPPIGSAGIYPVVMVANDGFGGIIKRTVTVTVNPDLIPPVITLNAPLPNPSIITPGTVYTDPGAVVVDNVSVGLVATVTSTLDINIVGTYTLTYNATDDAGNAAIPVVRTVIVNNAPIAGLGNVSFQEGVNSYFGTQDTELRMDIPTGNYGTTQSASMDGTTSPAAAGLDTYMLLQFNNIFGASPNQIPVAATINTASLGVYMTSGGNNVDMLQMLSPWQENTATWNSHAAAVNTGTPLRTLVGRPVAGSPLDISFSFPTFDVTTELQSWAGGVSNFGWGLKPTDPTSIDGATFATSEAAAVAERPILTVDYLATQRAVKTATNTNITLTLAGFDVDAQPLSAKITSLPLNGSLFQTTNGITLGTAIIAVPAAVSNATGQVIFVPTPAFSGQTSFNYVVNDGVEDSLPASILVHVDAVAPVITLNGAASVTTPLNAVYNDAGATASDNVSGNITANIVTNNPVNTTIAGLYTITYDVFDAAGNAAIQAARVVKVNAAPLAGAFTQTFKQGINGYTGGQDTELNQSSPTANFGTNININIDGDSPVGSGSDTFAMMRFGNIFGAAQNQIPLNSNILDASLNLYLSSGGHHVDMLQMLTTWTDTTATWNTHNAAVTGGTLLRTLVGRPIAGSPLDASATFPAGFNVSTEVQAWANGIANFGWGFKPFNPAATDGVRFGSHDRAALEVAKRPQLTVIYQNPAFTVSTPINTNTTITLGGYDANNDVLTSKITSLPLAGVLYDTVDGITLGAPITVVPTTVSNANQQVIFVPTTGTAGLAYASFDFVVNDGTIDSLPATVTVDVIQSATTISAANGNATITTGPNCNTLWSSLGSPYTIESSVTVTTGCRLQIDPYTVMKFTAGTGVFVEAGATLDIYGAANAPLVMTTVNDDSVLPILATSTGVPVIGSWTGIQYQASSLGSVSDAQVHYANNALEIAAASPTVTNFTATEFAGIGLYLRSFAANQTTSPNISNIVLNTTDTFNYPISMLGSVNDATRVVAPIINGTSITTASTSTAAGAIYLSGIGVNPTISNMTINGGGYNVYAIDNASGTFTGNTFNNAASEAIFLSNNANGTISMDSTNIITNTPAPYVMNQAFPSADIYASLGAGVVDTYTVHLSGNFNAANNILTNDPLNTGSSAYLVAGSIGIANGSRLQVDPYTVMKFNAGTSIIVQLGGTLDVYGAPTAPVVMTTVNDDTVLPILATSTGVPAIGSWSGIQYQASSLGSVSDAQVHYANNALEIAAASPTITNFTATEFGFIGLYLRSFAANQTTSPTVSNIVLNTTDTFNYPISMLGSVNDATRVVAPIISGTSITTASTSTAAGAIHLSGIGVNPSISGMVINGGGYNVYAIDNASGTFTGNTFNGAASAAIYLVNGVSPVIDASNTVQNTPAAYELANQLLPITATPLLGVNGIGITDPYSLRITGTLPASIIDYIMNPDPLGIGNSVYQVTGVLNVASGARLVINQGSVIKAVANTLNVNSGGTLDIYGAVGAPVTFTSMKDDSIGGDTNLDGAATLPASREGLSINYQTGSLGSMSFFDMRYSDGFTISSAIPMNDVSRFNGGFGMKFSGIMNQTVSNLTINHVGIGGDTALYFSGVGTNPVFTGVNTVDKYSAIHEGVIIRTGANPVFQNFTIDLHGNGQPALAIYDAATAVTVRNNIIQNADEAVLIGDGASPTIDSNIIRNSNTGVYLAIWFRPVTGQAGNAIITNNKIIGNNTGVFVHNATSAIIEHNLIRTNANVGVTIHALQTLPITLQNNLIVQNGTDLVNNGGVRLLDDPAGLTGANVTLLSNTIANNLGTGLSIDAYASATLNDNIIANNTTNFAVVPTGLPGDYNLTNAAIFPSAGQNIAGVIPQFANSWYLSDGSSLNGNTALISPAINASVLRTPIGVGYLTLNPYAQTAVTDINQLDIGYHHATPDVTASLSSIGSTVVTDTLLPGLGGNIIITITPNILQSGLEISATITSIGNTVGAVSLAKDLGDGTYQVIFTASALPFGTDIVNISVNGILLGSTGTITW